MESKYRLPEEKIKEIADKHFRIGWGVDIIEFGKDLLDAQAESFLASVVSEKLKEEILDLYCKWCPKDADEDKLTLEERRACLAASGFADEILPSLQLSKAQAVEEAVKKERERIIKWADELCPHSWGKYPNLGGKNGCQRCWEALKADKE